MEPAVTPVPLPPEEPATKRCRNDEAVAADLEGGHEGGPRDLVTSISRGSLPYIYLAACTQAGAFDEVLEEGMKGIEVGDLNGDGTDEILVIYTTAGSRSYGLYEFAGGRLQHVRDEHGKDVEIMAGGTFDADGEQGNWGCTRDVDDHRQLIVQVTLRPTNIGDPSRSAWTWTRDSLALAGTTLRRVSSVSGRIHPPVQSVSQSDWPLTVWPTSVHPCATRDEWGSEIG